MKTARRILLTALAVAALPAMAQNAAMLRLDDILGVWNLAYETGETGSFTVSKNEDGSAKIVVSTTAGGESAARDIKIEGDAISFGRDINVGGQAGSVNYTARLVDGKLQGTGLVNLGGAAGGGAPAAAPTPFTATRAP